jgi:hypothetical protein
MVIGDCSRFHFPRFVRLLPLFFARKQRADISGCQLPADQKKQSTEKSIIINHRKYRVFNNSVFAGFVFRNIWRILDSRVSLESWKEGASAYVLCSYLFDFFGYFRVMGLHSIVLFFSPSKITYKVAKTFNLARE